MRAMMVAAVEMIENTIRQRAMVHKIQQTGLGLLLGPLLNEAGESETGRLIFIGALRHHGIMTDSMIEQALKEFRAHLNECGCVGGPDNIEQFMELTRKAFDSATKGYKYMIQKQGVDPETLPKIQMSEDMATMLMKAIDSDDHSHEKGANMRS